MLFKTVSSLFFFGALAAVTLAPVLSLADDAPYATVKPAVIVPDQLQTSLSIDLDGDGRPDSVEIRSLNQNFNRLQVRLTKSGKEIVFDGLVRTTWEKLYPNNAGGDDTEVQYCSAVTQNLLEKGKLPGTFALTEVYSDFGGCAGEGDRILIIGLEHGKLTVLSARSAMNSWSMGDPSPIVNLFVDFQSRTAYASAADHHEGLGTKPVRAKADLPSNCSNVPLELFELVQLPSCAAPAVEKVAEKVGASCGRVSEFDDVCWPKNKD